MAHRLIQARSCSCRVEDWRSVGTREGSMGRHNSTSKEGWGCRAAVSLIQSDFEKGGEGEGEGGRLGVFLWVICVG